MKAKNGNKRNDTNWDPISKDIKLRCSVNGTVLITQHSQHKIIYTDCSTDSIQQQKY